MKSDSRTKLSALRENLREKTKFSQIVVRIDTDEGGLIFVSLFFKSVFICVHPWLKSAFLLRFSVFIIVPLHFETLWHFLTTIISSLKPATFFPKSAGA